MAQQRYHNYLRPLSSLEENFRIVGINAPGVYCGFDGYEVVSGTLLKIKHNVTGAYRLKLEGDSNDGPFGTFVTRQGVVVYDDTEVQQTVPLITTNPRVDILVATHTFLSSAGGAPATYSLIQGAEDPYPVPPSLTNPLSQIILGYFYVYSDTDHTTTIFERADTPKLGGEFSAFTKASEQDLRDAKELDFNKIQKTGLYFMNNVTTNRPSASTPYWSLMVFRKGDRLSQLALDIASGRVYARAALTFTNGRVATWGSWLNLNNADIVSDIQALADAIGTRLYTEENYVTDGETLTASIDILDISMKDIDIILDQAVIDIDNLETALGNRTYDENNVIADGESITASLNKLDKSFGYAGPSDDANDYIVPGLYGLSGVATNAPYSGATGVLMVVRTLIITTPVLYQFVVDFGSAISYRSKNPEAGGSWSSWTPLKHKEFTFPVTGDVWNMDTTATFTKSHIVGTGFKIKKVDVLIRESSGSNNMYEFVGPHGSVRWDSSNIYADRVAGGQFDNATFNAAMVIFRIHATEF